ncbi:MAG: hypothetical protein WC516_08515 [Patescibacteria group bacterium]|jgi:hypothetical protein
MCVSADLMACKLKCIYKSTKRKDVDGFSHEEKVITWCELLGDEVPYDENGKPEEGVPENCPLWGTYKV